MKDNKLSVVALVIGLVALASVFFGIRSHAPASDQSLGAGGGGTVYSQQDQYINGVGIGPTYITFSKSGTIGAGSNIGGWTNRSGRTAYVDLFSVTTTGTASSTYSIYAYASSSAPSTTYDFVTPASADKMLISNFALATSSTATTTSSLEKAPAGKVVRVPDGWTLYTILKAPAASCPSVAGSCESATSTNRGFNLDWYIRAYYKP